MSITEPATLVTDYVMAAFAVAWAVRLERAARRQASGPIRLWAMAFGFLALGAFTGGTYHGFHDHLGPGPTGVLWKASLIALGAGSFVMLWGVLRARFRGLARRLLVVAAAVKLVIFLLLVFLDDRFLVALVDFGLTMLVILVLRLEQLVRRGEQGGTWMIAGVLVSCIAAGVQQSGLSAGPYINHNDLFHIVQIAGLYFLYRGGALLKSLPA